jgi:hypothetical protein
MEQLEISIVNQDIENIQTEINNLLNLGHRKDITSFLIHLYCDKYINKNIWVLKELHKNINLTEYKLSITELQTILTNIATLISLNSIKSLHLYKQKEINIQEILYTSTYTLFHEIEEFKNILKEEIFELINILSGNIILRTNIQQTFTIINFILNSKKNKVFNSKSSLDVVDLLFLIIIKLLNSINEEDISEYVILCKDLFYYRVKKVDKLNRINLMFYCVFVMVHRHLSNQEILYQKQKENKYDYLYIKFNVDKNAIKSLNADKAPRIPEYKSVTVNNSNVHQDNTSVILSFN